MDSYGRELGEVAARLRGGGVASTIRGDAEARFVFAERGSRAVEISRNGPGWWAEFWEGEAVGADRSYLTVGEVIQAAAAWLVADPADQGPIPDCGGNGGTT
jgi:hypothetical protein